MEASVEDEMDFVMDTLQAGLRDLEVLVIISINFVYSGNKRK